MEHSQKTIGSLLHLLHTQIRWHLPQFYTEEEKIKLYQKIIDILNIIYEEGDLDFKHLLLNDSYYGKVHSYLKLGNAEEAVINLKKSAEHAIAYVTRPDMQRGKSLLTNTLTLEKAKSSTGIEKNAARLLKDLIVNVDDYKLIRNDERVQKILAELDKYAD
jgi:DNA polymerase III delta prime subunit